MVVSDRDGSGSSGLAGFLCRLLLVNTTAHATTVTVQTTTDPNATAADTDTAAVAPGGRMPASATEPGVPVAELDTTAIDDTVGRELEGDQEVVMWVVSSTVLDSRVVVEVGDNSSRLISNLVRLISIRSLFKMNTTVML